MILDVVTTGTSLLTIYATTKSSAGRDWKLRDNSREKSYWSELHRDLTCRTRNLQRIKYLSKSDSIVLIKRKIM